MRGARGSVPPPELALDQRRVWDGLAVLVRRRGPPPERLPEEERRRWRGLAASVGGRLDEVRLLSPGKPGGVHFYEPEAGRLVGRSDLRVLPFRGEDWGDLGGLLEQFHALVPVAEVWAWSRPGAGAAASAFRFRRPAPWTLLAGLTLLKPWAPVHRRLLDREGLRVRGLAFDGDRMELHVEAAGQGGTG